MGWFRNKDDMVSKAKKANELLLALGIPTHTESGKQLRSAIAMELLGESYDVMDKRSKADFVKQNKDVMGAVRNMLVKDGVLSNPGNQLEYEEEYEAPKALDVSPKKRRKR